MCMHDETVNKTTYEDKIIMCTLFTKNVSKMKAKLVFIFILLDKKKTSDLFIHLPLFRIFRCMCLDFNSLLVARLFSLTLG